MRAERRSSYRASDETVGSDWPSASDPWMEGPEFWEDTTAEGEFDFDLQTGEAAPPDPIDGAWELDDAWEFNAKPSRHSTGRD